MAKKGWDIFVNCGEYAGFGDVSSLLKLYRTLSDKKLNALIYSENKETIEKTLHLNEDAEHFIVKGRSEIDPVFENALLINIVSNTLKVENFKELYKGDILQINIHEPYICCEDTGFERTVGEERDIIVIWPTLYSGLELDEPDFIPAGYYDDDFLRKLSKNMLKMKAPHAQFLQVLTKGEIDKDIEDVFNGYTWVLVDAATEGHVLELLKRHHEKVALFGHFEYGKWKDVIKYAKLHYDAERYRLEVPEDTPPVAFFDIPLLPRESYRKILVTMDLILTTGPLKAGEVIQTNHYGLPLPFFYCLVEPPVKSEVWVRLGVELEIRNAYHKADKRIAELMRDFRNNRYKASELLWLLSDEGKQAVKEASEKVYNLMPKKYRSINKIVLEIVDLLEKGKGKKEILKEIKS